MNIIVIGASGFIGRETVGILSGRNYQITAVSRNPERAAGILGRSVEVRKWNGRSAGELAEILEGKDGIINLSGENLAGGLWTRKRKLKLIASRVDTGRAISDAVLQLSRKPSFLLQQSATGYYGPITPAGIVESAGSGSGFLAGLTREWESSVSLLAEAGIRVVYLRTGIVLGNEGGILPKLMRPLRFYVGSIPGNGRQMISWVHIHDAVNAIAFLAGEDRASGAFNLTAPNPCTMRELVSATASNLGRPVVMTIPDLILKTALGEMAVETILSSQQILPDKLMRMGFRFNFEDITAALEDLTGRKQHG